MDTWMAFLKGFAGQLLGLGSRVGRMAGSDEGAPVRPPDVIKEPPMEIDGRVMSADEFVSYVEKLEFEEPLPTRIFLHHTWKPTLESWRGRSTLLAMKAYYERQLWQDSQGRWHEGWTAGPHLFVANDGIWLFSDLRRDGVGVKGYNEGSRHLEMVGNYDEVLPSGAVLSNTVAALGILHERLGLNAAQLNFHRDFSTKSCPGRAVRKEWIIPQVQAWIEAYRHEHGEPAAPEPTPRQTLMRLVQEQLVPTNPEAALAKAGQTRGLLGALTSEVPLSVNGRQYVAQLFVEALIVGHDEWGDVRSLHEFEEIALKNP